MNRNRLLARIPIEERRRLLELGQRLPLAIGGELSVQDAPVKAIIFPLSGALAANFQLDAFPPLQLALVGAESCVGAALVLGSTRHACSTRVLQAGEAFQLPAKVLTQIRPYCPMLLRLLSREIQREHRSLVAEAACMRFHAVAPRLARWMLSCVDRNGGVPIEATHLEMAARIGVRREAVSVAAFDLQSAGGIRYQRGRVEILDYELLLTKACSCYKKLPLRT